jgi:hypothetical protein
MELWCRVGVVDEADVSCRKIASSSGFRDHRISPTVGHVRG